MKYSHPATLCGFLVVFVSLMVGVGGAVADERPDGCVDCHVKKQGQTDLRLNALLHQIGHEPIERTRNVPRDCQRCHRSADVEGLQTFDVLMHAIHYDVPRTNTFITKYGGDCRNCHGMDADTGVASVKGGKKNW